MRPLDRLGWAAGQAFGAYGLRIGVRVSDEGVLARLPGVLPPGWKPAARPVVEHLYSWIVGGPARGGRRRLHVLYSGTVRLVRTSVLEDVLDVLRNDVEYRIAGGARNRVFLHAGAVAIGGRALLLPGPSGAGKSHLVAALVAAGASYLSDEYAPLDDRGRVHPFPRTPGVDVPARDEVRRALPVGGVVLLRYRDGGRTRLRPLSPGQGLLKLVESAVPVRECPERTLSALARVLAGAPVLAGVRGEAALCAGRIIEWFSSLRSERQVA